MVERALRHIARDLPADRAETVEPAAIHSQHLALGLLGVCHEPAVEQMATARNVGQQRGEEPASAAFGRGNAELERLSEVEDAVGPREHLVGHRGGKGIGGFSHAGLIAPARWRFRPGLPSGPSLRAKRGASVRKRPFTTSPVRTP
jgi:hypothetical protein